MEYPLNDRTYRVGIVGTGGIAHAHGQACAQLECAELVAICDVSESALNRYGETFGIDHRYLVLDDMLDSEALDIAIICTWGAYHAQTAIQLAQSGKVKAILCEKPFSSTALEATQMVAAAREHGVLLAEAFKFRHHPMHLKLKQLVDSGTIGEIVNVRSTFCAGGGGGGPATRPPESNWRFNKAKGGGSIYDLGCYCIHHARFIFGMEPVQVFASRQMGMEVDDASYMLLAFPGGKTAQISVGFNLWPSQYAEVCGTQGMLRVDQAWNNEHQPVTLEQQSNSGTERIDFEPTFQFAHQLRHLCDCLSTGEPHRIPPENSIHQMRVLDAVRESMAEGRSIPLSHE